MNKKLLFLLVGMIVCLSVIGGALAVNYFNAAPGTLTVPVDEAIVLGWGETGAFEDFELAVGAKKSYTITAQVAVTSNAKQTGALTITTAAAENKNLNNVVFTLTYGSGESAVTKSVTGVGTITVEGLTTNTVFTLTIELPQKPVGDYTQEELDSLGGTVSVDLAPVAVVEG